MILIDTSAWIEFFRATESRSAFEVRRLLTEEADQIAMCEPVAMEILSGATDDTAHVRLEQLVNGLPSLALDAAVDFRTGAQIYRAARRAGKTIRSINDCLIAAVALRHGAHLVHRDADFDVIAAMTGLATTSYR